MAAADTLILAALDRHAGRRAKGLPILSVLLGPDDAALRIWQQWAQSRQFPAFTYCDISPPTFVPAIVAQLSECCNLHDLAIRFLAKRCGFTAEELRSSLQSKSLYDFEHFWQSLNFTEVREGTWIVIREVCRQTVAADLPPPSQLAATFDSLLATGSPWLRTLTAMDGLFSPAERPAILFTPRSGSAIHDIAVAARQLADLAETVPCWHVAVAMNADAYAAYDAATAPTREKMLFTSGVLRINSVDSAELCRRLTAANIDPAGLDGPIGWIVAAGAAEKLVDSFIAAAATRNERTDAARSAAERFLFQLLESLPQTRGCFTLNARLNFRFGAQPAEIDLWAENMGLAVEVDGYHHFTDPSRYRRDRRKDWELQSRGYWVVRVLAEDVIARMEEVKDQILVAVEHCRKYSRERGNLNDHNRDR